MSAAELAALRDANIRLRDKLLEIAAQCPTCHGTGLRSLHFPGFEGAPEWDADDQPCPDCADIRAVLE